MSYLAFHSRTATIHLTGREVRHIAALANGALAAELSLPGHHHLRAELGLPAADPRFFGSQLLRLMSDGETHPIQGHDVYVFELALNVLYQRRPAAGILCWLYNKALIHGWVADADRQAMAGQIQAALDARVARPRMADHHEAPLVISGCTIPAGDRGGWEEVISFLRGGTGDVVTSVSVGDEFPGHQLALDARAWQPAVTGAEEPADALGALWDQLGDGEQWDLCMQALRTRPHLQWQPTARYTFGEFTLRQDAGLVAAC
jgi:hypothetical protein